ncbi:universal stress protein [Sedimentitalea sp. JM2-8]|uniref:Universal stress protein n=1 Tax=Sedimentitalea xiamensis TaxID=3050037 RepID=A0ABT7FG01_9RHOB|nr:universal stress protein [Sedimentitalea xiamensis]MDK3073910.1 universal stress protein [Sedimentitalea xiamensis]
MAFNGSESSEGALKAAVHMQQKYGAHITGLLAHEGKRERFSQRPWMPENVREIIEKSVHADEDRVGADFHRLVGDVPPDKVHWITLSGEPDTTVAQYACLYDITVVGRHTADDVPDASLHPERIALNSGRPVLVVPPGFDKATINRPAVLAWDGARAATRALNDAMLVIETKQRVDVLSVGKKIRRPLKAIDVVTTLARHGVGAKRVRREQSTRSVGEEILAYCDEVDAGLLVMGAFEHSAFREELFGGTTKTVLANARIPVLISH